jgi:hypothetical protein
VPDFPYATVFTIEETGVIILAIEHDRRDPDYWRNRLEPRCFLTSQIAFVRT